jgi:hypothetical protein
MDWRASSRSQSRARGSGIGIGMGMGVGMGMGIGMDWHSGSRSQSRSRPSQLHLQTTGMQAFESDGLANNNNGNTSNTGNLEGESRYPRASVIMVRARVRLAAAAVAADGAC